MPPTSALPRPRRATTRRAAPRTAATSATGADRWARAADADEHDAAAPLPLVRFDALQQALGLSLADLGTVTGLVPRTLQRRRARGLDLDAREAAPVRRLERLFALAVVTFGSPAAAADWFSADVPALGGTPLARAATDPGARAVEHVLAAVEFGFAA